MGTTYYVSVCGSNNSSNPTDRDTPWKTLNHALTGKKLSPGDELVILDNPVPVISTINSSFTSGKGKIVIRAETSNKVEWDMGEAIQFKLVDGMIFKWINFTNRSGYACSFGIMSESGHVRFEECEVDHNNAGVPAFCAENSTGEGQHILWLKSKFRRCSNALFRSLTPGGNSNDTFSVLGSYIDCFENVFVITNSATYELINNTLVNPAGDGYVLINAEKPGIIIAKNNNVELSGGSKGIAIRTKDAATTAHFLNSDNLKVTHNNFFGYVNPQLILADNNLYSTLPLDYTNTVLEPIFKENGAFPYEIDNAELCHMEGDVIDGRLGEIDLDGKPWRGRDVGCSANPEKADFQLNPAAGFLGSSIMYGYGAESENSCWSIFERLSGIKTVQERGNNPMAFPGYGIDYVYKKTDALICRYKPGIIFLSNGGNNFDDNGIASYPMGITDDTFIKRVVALLRKIQNYGIEAIWIGMSPLQASGSEQATPTRINNLINAECEKYGIKCISFLAEMMKDESWNASGGKFYNNLAVDDHPNSKGHELIARVCCRIIAENI